MVSTLYRAATGDTLDPGARLLGGALFGGIGGLAAAVVNALVEEETGADIGANILASLTGDGDATAATARAPLPPAPTKEAAGALPDPASPAAPDTPAGLASAKPVSLGGAPADVSRVRTPISLLPRPAPEAPESAALAGKAMAVAPPDAVPRLMQDALDKYEALNRGRRGRALAEEI